MALVVDETKEARYTVFASERFCHRVVTIQRVVCVVPLLFPVSPLGNCTAQRGSRAGRQTLLRRLDPTVGMA